MELKDFVKKAILEIVEGVEEANASSVRGMWLKSNEKSRTIEFDIAVSAESTNGSEGNAGIKVWQVLEGGGSLSNEEKNSTVTRLKFGIYVQEVTKREKDRIEKSNEAFLSARHKGSY